VTAQSGTYADSNPFRFSTKQFDGETGLYYFGYRYYSPGLGKWISRDPIEEQGTLVLMGRSAGRRLANRHSRQVSNLYKYAGNDSISRVDALGLFWQAATQPGDCCNYCGPDVSAFVLRLVNSAISWQDKARFVGADGMKWLYKHGKPLDWWSTTGPYNVKDANGNILCPAGDNCRHTYWLCGECVHDHWIGNFMYGFLGRLFGIPDWVMNTGGWWYQGPGLADAPWDTAGYGLARRLYDEIKNDRTAALTVDDLCADLKKDQGLWNSANDTSVTGPKYPKPHAKNYKDCKKCPHDLTENVVTAVPGGKLGGAWPPP
jgi:RHS repeat-associated protein